MRAQDRAGGAEGQRLLGGDDADALQPLPPDRLAGHEHVVLVEARLGDRRADREHVVAPAVGQVGGDAAGADEVVVHPQAGDLLEEAQHLLALAPAVEHHRHGAEVHAVGGEEQQVADDIRLSSLISMRIHVARSGMLDVEQLLGGHARTPAR